MQHTFIKAMLCTLILVSSSAHSEVRPARMLSVYKGPGCEGAKRLLEFESSFLGAKVDLATDALDSRSWKALHDSVAWGSSCWSKAGRKLTIGLPMLPKDGSSTLAQGAQGSYDEVFDYVAKTLIATGNADAIVRIGWEFNGKWFPWAAARDPENYKGFWRRIVSIFRNAPGANFRFDWCAALGKNEIAPDLAYPGDDVVDIVGANVYNNIWSASASNAEARWLQYEFGPYGLGWQRDFARSHGKLMSFPEWGTGDRPDGHGAGDDAYFIRKMSEWIKSSPVEYHGYWDYRAADYDAMVSDGRRPNAAKAFKEAFGSLH